MKREQPGPLDSGPPERKRMLLSRIVEPVHVLDRVPVELVDVVLLVGFFTLITVATGGRC